MRKIKNINTEIIEIDNINELSETQQKLINAAREAATKSYAPYSKFNVGAAVLLDDGKIIKGTNQENAAYPSGLCAERTALFWANSEFPDKSVKSIAITALKNGKIINSPLAPCGSCRQVMLETETRYNNNMEIILDSSSYFLIINSAKDLLPIYFDGSALS